MPSPREPLQATPFEPAPRPETPEPETSRAPRWVIPALGVLLLLGLLVVFWLPNKVGPAAPRPVEPVAERGNPDPATADREAADAAPQNASPWSDAQAAKLRQEAKAVLEQLLDVQFELEERGVTQWAAEEYAAVVATARSGDDQYREHRYPEARSSYQQALESLQAITARIPGVMDAQLQAIDSAIEAGAVEKAEQTLAVARQLEPENAELPAREERVAVLPDVLEQLEAARAAEAEGDLAAATRALEEAVELDPQHQRAADELARVSTARDTQAFSEAMSAGYRALDDGDYASARKAFNRAAGLRGDASEARNALAEVAAAEQSGRLGTLQRQGARQQADEDWAAAVKTYEQALAVDDSVVFARDGLPRARERAALDDSLQSVIDEPGRLSDVAVAESTAALLERAAAIGDPGPKLQRQTARVSELLEKANSAIPVTLRSDGQTEVIVYKVARLGTFQQRELELRPGSYRVRGSRIGYRDVLHTLEVSHDAQPPTLSVICTEKIL